MGLARRGLHRFLLHSATLAASRNASYSAEGIEKLLLCWLVKQIRTRACFFCCSSRSAIVPFRKKGLRPEVACVHAPAVGVTQDAPSLANEGLVAYRSPGRFTMLFHTAVCPNENDVVPPLGFAEDLCCAYVERPLCQISGRPFQRRKDPRAPNMWKLRPDKRA